MVDSRQEAITRQAAIAAALEDLEYHRPCGHAPETDEWAEAVEKAVTAWENERSAALQNLGDGTVAESDLAGDGAQ